MILIPQKLILEDCLGINPIGFLASKTDVSRRTITDDFKGKRIMALKSRQKMLDDIRAWIVANVTEGIVADVTFDPFVMFSNDADVDAAQKYPWSRWLNSFEQGILLRYKVTRACDQDARILSPKSIDELQVMEDVNYSVSEAFYRKDWISAKTVLLAEWERIPLLHASIFQKEKDALSGIDSSEKFQLFCSVLALSSVMYILALVDLGFSHDGNTDSAESLFQDLVLAQDHGNFCPVKEWIDGIGIDLGLNGTNALGREISQWKHVDDDTGIREVKRWRSGEVPRWDTAFFICDKLGGDGAGDLYFKHVFRYGAARMLHRFHEYCMGKIIAEGRSDVLKMIYDEYPKWYRHHQQLNTKAPA